MKKNNTLGAGGWMLGLVLSLLFSMVLGVALIWLSIDRNDTAYSIRKLQQRVEETRSHVNKLEVERDSLLSPYVLGRCGGQMQSLLQSLKRCLTMRSSSEWKEMIASLPPGARRDRIRSRKCSSWPSSSLTTMRMA